jgi:ParB/RepB/Spo0J family partition protein
MLALSVPLMVMDEPTEMLIDAIRVISNVRDEVGDIRALVASVQQHGVIEPLIVKPDGELIAGHRRLAAAKATGLTHVPVRVRAVRDPRVALEIGLIENVQRRDLEPLSRARAYHALIHEYGAEVEEVARLVGQGVAHIYQHLQLLDLHPDVQAALRTEKISFADARELAPLAPEDQVAVLTDIRALPKRATSRQVKQIAQARRALAAARRQATNLDADGADGDCYGDLFAHDQSAVELAPQPDADAASELNAIVAEMLAAAQGEDQLRAWARRLGRLAADLKARGLLLDECAARITSREEQSK